MNYKLLQYVFPLGMILFPSCSVALNMIAHSQVKNPKVMTEQQCLDYAEENLRAGIKDIYIIPCESNDSARELAMSDYFAIEERVFDENELEFDGLDSTIDCRWRRFALLSNIDSIQRYMMHTDSAQTLEDCLRSYKPIRVSDVQPTYPVTFLLGLSPDNGKLNLTPSDINRLYDEWEGRCRIIVVFTNPQESWGLLPNKRVRYKMHLYKREARTTQASITYTFPRK